MYYYLFYKDGVVVGYNCSKTPLNNPSYKEVTEEEYWQYAGSRPSFPATPEERIGTLESDNNLLKQQLKAASDQNEFLEDCIAEMAGIVYA